MLSSSPLALLWTPGVMFFVVTLPAFLFFSFAIVMLLSSHATGAKASKVGVATFHYLMQGVGILLMTIGSLPTLISVLSQEGYSGRVYMSLLWIFLVGGALFLWHEQCAIRTDRAAASVPQAIFTAVVKTMGYLTAVFAVTTIIVAMTLQSFSPFWWVSPIILLLYGILLTWSVSGPSHGESAFENTPLHDVVKPAPKHVAKKVVKKAKKWHFPHLFAKRA